MVLTLAVKAKELPSEILLLKEFSSANSLKASQPSAQVLGLMNSSKEFIAKSETKPASPDTTL